ncbi:MAG: hypothetical protein DWQ02_02310 [Bacteroidetes bacterium]|nr:MAG: hypothetical protein DWQ02_02310 [Bacteroidota bacterium]
MYGKGKYFFFPLIILALLGFGLVVMLLWNAILPNVTGVSKLTYWQAVGLLLLSKILFGSFRPGKKSHRHKSKAQYWRKKWMSMSDEERAKFKQEWRHRCGPNDKESEGRDIEVE